MVSSPLACHPPSSSPVSTPSTVPFLLLSWGIPETWYLNKGLSWELGEPCPASYHFCGCQPAKRRTKGGRLQEVRGEVLLEGKWDVSGPDIGGVVSPIQRVGFLLISSGLDSSGRKKLPGVLADGAVGSACQWRYANIYLPAVKYL